MKSEVGARKPNELQSRRTRCSRHLCALPVSRNESACARALITEDARQNKDVSLHVWSESNFTCFQPAELKDTRAAPPATPNRPAIRRRRPGPRLQHDPGREKQNTKKKKKNKRKKQKTKQAHLLSVMRDGSGDKEGGRWKGKRLMKQSILHISPPETDGKKKNTFVVTVLRKRKQCLGCVIASVCCEILFHPLRFASPRPAAHHGAHQFSSNPASATARASRVGSYL